jgi:aspartate racemase
VHRKLGIVGGLGWRATADYYAAIHELAARTAHRALDNDPAALELTIESLDHSVAHSLLLDGERDGRWEGFDNYHRAALLRLERAEAEVALIACNTPHERLPSIARGTRIEIVDLFEAVSAEAKRRGARRLLVLGTATTMKSERLSRLLRARGIERIVPGAEYAGTIEALIDDLQETSPCDSSARLVQIVRTCLAAPRPGDFVGLLCTELPLALPAPGRSAVFELEGIRFLNASIAHAEAALRSAGHLPSCARTKECRVADY